MIDGLTPEQSLFVETFIVVPKHFGRKKAKKRREVATTEFRRFNVNHDAVEDRIRQITDTAVRGNLLADLAHAEEIIEANPKKLDFDGGHAHLVKVNELTRLRAQQQDAKLKFDAAQAQMDALDRERAASKDTDVARKNQSDIDLVWGYVQDKYINGMEKDAAGDLDSAVKALDRLAVLLRDDATEKRFELRSEALKEIIENANDGLNEDVLAARRELIDVSNTLPQLRDRANRAFTAQAVPADITTLLEAVDTRLEDAADGTPDTLPGLAAAARAALTAATTETEKRIGEKMVWIRQQQIFLRSWDMITGHTHKDEATYVKPKFDQIEIAYNAAVAKADSGDFAGATADLAPLVPRAAALVTLADDYGRYLDMETEREAMIVALPPAARYDKVPELKTANEACRTLLAQAKTARDAEDMATATARLDAIPAAVARFHKLDTALDDLISKRKKVKDRRAEFALHPPAVINAVQSDLDLMDRIDQEAWNTARGGDVASGTHKLMAMSGFLNALKKKIDIVVEFHVEKPLFDARLLETENRDGAEGRIAIEDYYQNLLNDRDRINDYTNGVDTDYGLALAAATALKDQHTKKMALADQGKDYLALREKLTTEITRLEGGAAGGEQAAEAIAVTRATMGDATNATQNQDWYGAIYLLKQARVELAQGTRAAKIAEDIDGTQVAANLDGIAASFDNALGEFTKARQHVEGLDTNGVFAAQLNAAQRTAEAGRAFATANPADPASARAAVEAGIAACKEVGTMLVQLKRCEDQSALLAPVYSDLKSKNKNKLLDPELAFIKARFGLVKQKTSPKALDLPGAMAALAEINTTLRVAHKTLSTYDNYYAPGEKRLKTLLAELQKKKVAPGLGEEIARLQGILADMKTALDAREFANVRTKVLEGIDLEGPYYKLAKSYRDVTASYKRYYTDTGIKTLNHPAVTTQLTRIRDIIAGVDALIAQHAYESADYQIIRTSYLIDRVKKAIADFPAYEAAVTPAEVALQDLLNRDDAALGPAHDRIAVQKAIFDAARKDAGIDQFKGATRKLDGFVAACEEIADQIDLYDLYIAARDQALAELAKIAAVDTSGITPMFKRLEGKRDNALAKAAAFDFVLATTLFTELLTDCATAGHTLDGQKGFDEVMGKIGEIADGDREDLRLSIEAAQATLKQLRGNPSAMYVKQLLDDAMAQLQASSLKLDEDFDECRNLLSEVLDKCRDISVQMGQVDQLCDAAQLARDLAAKLAAHPQYSEEKTAVEAALSRVESAMANVRRDIATRAASDATVEDVIADLRALRTTLDAHAKYATERDQIRFDLNSKLEKHADRHMAKEDITKATEALDKAEAQATARDYPKAMAELKIASGRIPAGLLRIKLEANTIPDPADIRAFLSDKDSTKVLDDVIAGLEPDIQRKVIAVAFKERFGCDLSLSNAQWVQKPDGSYEKQITDDNDMDRDAPNLRRFYDLMASLPESDTLDNYSFLSFEHRGGIQTGSAFNFVSKAVKMHEGEAKTSSIYATSSELELGAQDDLYKTKDGEPVSYFSWNTLHEVAHAVDDKLGFMSKHDGEGNDTYGGWKKHGANVDEIARAVSGKYNFDSTYVAEYMMRGKGSYPPVPEPNGCDAEEWARRRRDCEIWVDRARSTEDPWATKISADACTIGNRVYHESQPGDWVSYLASARAKGVTGYQFRAPAEWFSELYAAHHSKKLKDNHPAAAWLDAL